MTRQDRTTDNTRSGSNIRSGSLHGVAISNDYHVQTKMRADHDHKSEGDRVVAELRARLIRK